MEHVNIKTDSGHVYCRATKSVEKYSDAFISKHCEGCPFFVADAMGEGVICEWDDKRDIKEPYVVDNPNKEALEVSGDDDE